MRWASIFLQGSFFVCLGAGYHTNGSISSAFADGVAILVEKKAPVTAKLLGQVLDSLPDAWRLLVIYRAEKGELDRVPAAVRGGHSSRDYSRVVLMPQEETDPSRGLVQYDQWLTSANTW